MIVRPGNGVLHLITQPDHAALAGRVMAYWTALADHPRRASILHAIAEHDNGWQEPDAAPVVDPGNGRVADFISIPVEVRQAVWPRGVMRLSQDRWAAALVAQHAAFVYSRLRSDRDWNGFFSEMEAARDAYADAAARPLDELMADYDYVRLGDLISLMFCTAWTDPQEHAGYTVSRRDDRIVVAPDPFGGRGIPFEITARELPDRTFASDDELREAFASARTVTLRGTAIGRHE